MKPKTRLALVNGGRGKPAKKAMKPSVVRVSGELAKSLAEEACLAPIEPKTIHPTASKTDLLFACSFPWGRQAPHEPVGERTRFGSAFHEGMESGLGAKEKGLKIPSYNSSRLSKRWNIDADELRTRLDEALPVLRKWLSGYNTWSLNFLRDAAVETEVSIAFNPTSGEARLIDGPTADTHEYVGVGPDEIPGTADVTAIIGPKTARIILVEDHKSGWSVAADWAPKTPAENGQLRTLATAFASLYGADRAIVAFFHAPASGVPLVLADEMGAEDFETHRRQLRGALARIGNGWLRPGDHCSYCPGWSICPTNTTSLVELKRAGGPLTSQRVGSIHQALGEYNRLAGRLREEIRGWVTKNGIGERPDGGTVELVEREVERLSKASIIAALGPLKGNALLEQLRRAGALESKIELQLRAVPPTGR
jgi:PD-(D/E)XK nuclease superfamily